MMKTNILAIACGLMMSGWASLTCQAAILGYDDYAQFQAALGGAAETVIDFDSIGSGVILGTESGVTFSATDSNFNPIDLVVYETDPVMSNFNPDPTDTHSQANYVGRELFFDPAPGTTFEDETITFTFDSPRSAVGLFVIAPNNNGTILSAGGQTVAANFADPIVLSGSNQAFFIGLIDDGGANSISSASLQGNGDGYHFDSLTTSVAAVPEPSSFVALGALIAGVAVRRRRRSSPLISC